MYAIIATGGKQIRVEEGRYVDVDKIAGDEGAVIEFSEVLLVSGDGLTIGTPTIAGAKVVGKIQSQWKGPKVIVYKMRPKKHYRRKNGHRQHFTRVMIDKISI